MVFADFSAPGVRDITFLHRYSNKVTQMKPWIPDDASMCEQATAIFRCNFDFHVMTNTCNAFDNSGNNKNNLQVCQLMLGIY